MDMNCKICGAKTNVYGKATVLKKNNVTYYECPECGFIQTEEPYWLDEAYSDAITQSDIGLCKRNIALSDFCNVLFRSIFKDKNSYIDYGGGYGMFVRLMRDKGYDFEWYDEYCSNLFAKTHEMKKKHYDVLTSFEMFEHLVNPLDTIQKLMELSDTVVFSTELVPENRPNVEDWWYFGTEHGQHIAFYTEKSLKIIAHKFNKKYYNLRDVHLITNVRLSSLKRFFLSHGKTRKIIALLYRKNKSLLADDYYALTGKKI